MKKVVITSAVRTPVGGFLGSLKTVPSQELAAIVIREALKRAGIDDPNLVDDVILGEVESSGEAPNVARVSAVMAGLDNVPGYTLNRICGSGLQAISNGFMQVQRGQDRIVIGGGTENLSRAPYYLPLSVRYDGFKNGDKTLLDSNTTFHRNTAPYEIWKIDHMGNTAENVVRKYGIPREDSDRFAYDSQRKCKAALELGRFDREIVPVEIKGRKGQVTVVDKDEHPKPNTTLEGLSTLKPVFEKDGTVTAGNASGINDGAAVVVLTSEEMARGMGMKPMAEVVDFTVAGLDPRLMGLGPVYAIRKLLERTKMTKEDIDIFEINEAFAGQMLGCLKELDMYLDTAIYERVNPNGGAVALGHPLGCTGGRLVTTATYELLATGKEYAIASACIGGGMGIAVLLRNAEA